MADTSTTTDDPVEDKEVELLDIPRSTQVRKEFICKEREKVIQALAQKSKKVGGIPDRSDPQIGDLYVRLERLLTWLRLDFTITPTMKASTKIDLGLQLMFDKPQYHFPQEYEAQARALFERWQDENWGESAIAEDESESESETEAEAKQDAEPNPKRRKTSTTAKPKKNLNVDDAVSVAKLKLAHPKDPLFGKESHMFGVAVSRGPKRKTLVLDDRYQHLRGNPKVYGHNGLEVGAWFPYQIVALFHGAHGSAMAGIYGDKTYGAYSIVVSGVYDDLDKDHGNYLYYSGSNSHKNKNPHQSAPSTDGTLALKASLLTEKPVRVLRSWSGKSEYAPTYGLRYDGLYEVTDMYEPINMKGGRYEQFKLVRLEGQGPIARTRPTPAEMRDFERLRGYS